VCSWNAAATGAGLPPATRLEKSVLQKRRCLFQQCCGKVAAGNDHSHNKKTSVTPMLFQKGKNHHLLVNARTKLSAEQYLCFKQYILGAFSLLLLLHPFDIIHHGFRNLP